MATDHGLAAQTLTISIYISSTDHFIFNRKLQYFLNQIPPLPPTQTQPYSLNNVPSNSKFLRPLTTWNHSHLLQPHTSTILCKLNRSNSTSSKSFDSHRTPTQFTTETTIDHATFNRPEPQFQSLKLAAVKPNSLPGTEPTASNKSTKEVLDANPNHVIRKPYSLGATHRILSIHRRRIWSAGQFISNSHLRRDWSERGKQGYREEEA